MALGSVRTGVPEVGGLNVVLSGSAPGSAIKNSQAETESAAGVTAEATPPAAVIMTQAEFLLELLIITFDSDSATV